MHVVGAFIVRDAKVLMLFRKNAQHYESVGGKLEESHDPPTEEELRTNLLREIREEIGNVQVKSLVFLGKMKYQAHNGQAFIMHKFQAAIDGEPQLLEPDLFGHLRWIPLSEIHKFPISAGSKPFLSLIRNDSIKKEKKSI